MVARFAAMTVALLTGLLALATLASCNTEGDILFTQRQEWKDSNNVLQSWDPTLVNPCTWFHITCNSNNSVIRVDLGNAGLSGSLVPELGGLSSLQYLELFGNSITGAIPVALGNLSSLVSLGLQGNQLTGMIPASLGYLTNLKYLELQKNALSGPIPASLGNIKTLQILRLNGNMLSGTVPSEILSLVLVGNLTEINVAKNNLSGTVASSRPRVTVIIQDTLKTAS